jgi:hypothetical protein
MSAAGGISVIAGRGRREKSNPTNNKGSAHMSSNATPRPWAKSTSGLSIKSGNQMIATAGQADEDQARADIDLIVRAVNAHEALVLALEMAQSDYEASYIALYHSVGDTGQQRIDCQQRSAVINAALAKARP